MVSAGFLDFEKAVGLTGHGRFHIFLLLAVGASLMSVIIETQGVMFIVPASKCDLDLGVTERGLLSSINYLGVFASSHLWGFLADTTGRRRVILTSLICSFICSVISSLIPVGWLFIVVRFFTGFFIGGSSAVIYAYAGEFNDANRRPQVVAWVTTSVAFGTLILPGLAWAILSMDFEWDLYFVIFRPWRLMVIAYSIFTIISIVGMSLIPESPKFLLAQGRHDEALEVLRWVYSVNSRNDPEEFPVKGLVMDEQYDLKEAKNQCQVIWQQTSPLFKAPFWKQTAMVCTMHFGVFVVCGVLMWYPEILIELRTYVNDHIGEQPSLCMAVYYYLNTTQMDHNETDQAVCNDYIDPNVFITSMYISAGLSVGMLSCAFLIQPLGKKVLLYIFLTIGGVASFVGQNVYGEIVLQVVLCGVILSCVAVSVVNAVIVDLYPTKIRGMALAISLMFGRIGAFVASNFTGPLLYGACDGILYIFGAIFVIMICITIMLPSQPPIETKTQVIKPV